eukprot:COSAG04_NODE_1697_length_5900_cov_4.347009_2_plen_213_part_00
MPSLRQVVEALGSGSGSSEQDSKNEDDILRLRHLRESAWQWEGVDGQSMDGIELLKLHAMKLTEQMTGNADGEASAHGHLEEATQAHPGGGGGQKMATKAELQAVQQQISEIERFVRHTHHMMFMLAQNSNVDVPDMPDAEGAAGGGVRRSGDAAAHAAPAARKAGKAALPARQSSPAQSRLQQRQQEQQGLPSPIMRKAMAAGVVPSKSER